MFLASCGSSKSTADLPYKKRKKFEHYYFEAAKQKVLENSDQSIVLFHEALKAHPKSHETMYQLSALYFAKGDYSLALAYAKDAVNNLSSYNHWYYGQLVHCYDKTANYKEAAKIAERMIAAETNNQDVYIEACNQYLNYADGKKALNVLDRMEKVFGVTELSATRKEFIYLKMGSNKQAVAALRDLIEAYPNVPVYRGYLAETLIKIGNPEQALEELLEMEKLDSSFGRAQMLLYDLLSKKGDYDQAFNHLLKAFALPDVDINEKLQAFTPYYLAASTKPKALTQAQQLSEALLMAYPDRDIPYIVKGDLCNQNADFSCAREAYKKAVDVDASDYRVWDKLISIDAKLENFNFQLEDSELAIERFPNRAGFYLAKSYALLGLKNFDEAIISASEGLEIAGDQRDKVELLSCLASAYHETKQFLLADQSFDKALRLDQYNVLIMNNYAYSLAKRADRLQFADSLISMALQTDPLNAFYMDTKAWVLFKMGKSEQAIDWLRKAIQFDPEGLEYFEHLAAIYYFLGNETAASENLIEAQRLGSTIQHLEELQTK